MQTTDRPPLDLDALLSAEPYLEDDGFTERVMARLPAGARPRGWIVVVMATLMAGVVLIAGGQAALIRLLTAPLTGTAGLQPGSVLPLVLGVLAVGALAWLPLTLALDED